MAKKDGTINNDENLSLNSPNNDGQPQLFKENEAKPQYTEVKNASASGLGSMGRTEGEEPESGETPT